ncbi:hypothetical protein SAMN02745163_04445 [Clostridium cavendishii DSM 21758]|uniref:SH3 domain-containing protein n=1 Tax=Clostridium cavendishii DSM 21758 TaxID=1121302 RepID=A0A1M6V833_9CLOT|nr:hypothetical protein [Clostridium cavendishii]SHK77598.1 hypothetical protein SAMN02745163_04445 [Clostridium cavendishii DSM 21758]
MKFAVFLIILLILACVAMFFYLNNQLIDSKSQYLSLNRQYINLREKYLKVSKTPANISILYKIPSNAYGTTKDNTNVYLVPLISLPLLLNLPTKTKVNIIDEAECDNEIWYYVLFPNESNINSKGWIKKSDFIEVIPALKKEN